MDLKILSVFLITFLIPVSMMNIYCQETGFKYFRNYSYREYDHQAQNWGIAQAQNGIIYVANNGGVLEFDGVSWRVIYVPNFSVRSLAVDESGIIYIGGKNEIGYLASDSKGSLKYVSLMNQLDESQKKFSTVWRTHATKEGIYFCPSQLLLRWDPKYKRMKFWKPTHPFLYSFTINGRILIHQEKIGLMQVANDSLVTFLDNPILKDGKERVFMVAPYQPGGDHSMLIGTRFSGFFLYNGKTMNPFPTEVDDYLEKHLAYHGICLNSTGDFAIATRLGGLVIIDSRGKLKYILDKTSGLQDNDVKYIYEDNRECLWLCLDNGISRVEYRSPFSIYDNRSGLPGIVLSVIRHSKDLYVGTTKGLFVFPNASKESRLVPKITGSCWSLVSMETMLLVASSSGVYMIDSMDLRKHHIIKDLSFALLPSRYDPNQIWCGTGKGLKAFNFKKNRSFKIQKFNRINQEIRNIAEDCNGHLWLVTSTGNVIEVDFSKQNYEPAITFHESSPGLSGVQVYSVAVAAGHIMFATEKGIYQYQPGKKIFLPDQTLGSEFASGLKSVFRISEDKNRNIWFHSQSRNYQAIPAQGGGYAIHSKSFRRIPTIQVNVIYPDPDGRNIWFGSNEGLICYDSIQKKRAPQDFKTLVRKVLVNGKLLFDGCKITEEQPSQDHYPIIEYKDRNLYFEYAAPFFEVENETNYRCFLEGYDGRWPSWNEKTNRDYTNLDSGLYTFRVQAKNVYQYEGDEGVFRFKILPPWYKTWWAIVIYIIGIVVFMLLVVKWRSVKLEREKQHLEQIVKERTLEINEKKQQLEEQTHQLYDQSEKLKELDKVKSRFFTNISHEFRTPLTLIMGPLEKMLSNSGNQEKEKELKVMLRNSQRLLRLINQLLDLSKLDSGKMKLNRVQEDVIPYIRSTVSAFESLAQQKEVNLSLKLEDDSVILYFDPERIEEILYNLLMNAIKFTPPKGKVTVSTKRCCQKGNRFPEGYFEISVCDTGIGITREKLPHIFDRFYQTAESMQQTHKGTGIGLALTKEWVLLHQGKIDVHSRGGEKSGTEFVIRLPLIVPQTESEQEVKRKTVDFPVEIGEGEEIEDAEIPEPLEKHGIPTDKNVILVVEDNKDVRQFIKGSLGSEYQVLEAKDGYEGIERAKEYIPDLIISDIMMPKKDGYELCQELKGEFKTSHIPIILLTAKASHESVIEGLGTGADDYITKPFNAEILIARIKNLIQLRSHLHHKIQKELLLQPAEIAVSSMDQKFIKELKQVIEKNLSDSDFHVEELSKEMYMDRSTLFRKIKALTGETPTDFIRSYRLQRAAQLLKDNFGNVSEVALEVGFSNFGHFSRCFKKKFHQSPSTYQASES